MIIKGIIILFLLFTIYLLFIPIIIFIDTETNEYSLEYKGIAKATIESDNEEIVKIKLNVFFFNFYYYPLQYINTEQFKTLKFKNLNINRMIEVIKTFKIKKLYINIDTYDCILNSKLYPISQFLKYYIGEININYLGKNRMMLQFKSRPIYIIKSIINN